MTGRILSFNATTGTGVISGDDGKRYSFENGEIHGGLAADGCTVDFMPEDTQAKQIYVQASNVVNSKKLPAALLALFLGTLGVHKFFLGYKKEGIIMLLVTIIGSFVVIGPVITAVISLIEFIIYIMKTDDDFENTYVKNSKPWF